MFADYAKVKPCFLMELLYLINFQAVQLIATLISCYSQSCFGKNLVIDPTAEEEAFQDGSFMVTYMPSRKEVTQLTLTGEWSTAKINEVEHVNSLSIFFFNLLIPPYLHL